MLFGEAIEKLKLGHTVKRRGWHGKNMRLVYVRGSTIATRPETPYAYAVGANAGVSIAAHIDMIIERPDTEILFQPGWLASQADMLADDWMIVE